MIINGDLESASLERFATVDLPSASAIKSRVVYDETENVALISNGTSYEKVGNYYVKSVIVPLLNVDCAVASSFYKESAVSFALTLSNTVDAKPITVVVKNNGAAFISITPPAGCIYSPTMSLSIPPSQYSTYSLIEINGNVYFSLDATSHTAGEQNPVGSIIQSMLTLAQFQSELGNGWVLMDGQSCVGSRFNAITGMSNVPDARGRFLRSKDHGGGSNPAGDLALGTYQVDELSAHTHSITLGQDILGTNIPSMGFNAGPSMQTSSYGGLETRPKNITVNTFIRIN